MSPKRFFRSYKHNQCHLDKKSVPPSPSNHSENLETWDLSLETWDLSLETWDLSLETWDLSLTNVSIDSMSLICLHNIATSSIHHLTTFSSPSIYPTPFPRVFWVPRTDSQKTAVVKTPIKFFSKCLNHQERFVPTKKIPGHKVWRTTH